jgi:hypothetical protein
MPTEAEIEVARCAIRDAIRAYWEKDDTERRWDMFDGYRMIARKALEAAEGVRKLETRDGMLSSQQPEIGRLKEALDCYRYAAALGEAWDGGHDLPARLAWARSRDPWSALTDDQIVRIGKSFSDEHRKEFRTVRVMRRYKQRSRSRSIK